jgi:nucleotide-binding universal stress UspA family protein
MPGRIQLIVPPRQATHAGAIDAAVSLSRLLDSQLTVAAPQTNAELTTHWLAREYSPTDLPTLAARSPENVALLKQNVTAAADAVGVTSHFLELVQGVGGSERSVIMSARTHDLSVLGLADQDLDGCRLAEELLFDSGRPLIIVPLSRPFTLGLDTIAIAWDHSEPASRVIAGAVPLIKQARRVFVFSVLGGKKLQRPDGAEDLATYLESHGVETTWETLESEDRARGRFIMETAIARGADLLVMGAYATLPAQELLVGGATLSVLNEPLLPVMMAN